MTDAQDFEDICHWLAKADVKNLELVEKTLESFPKGYARAGFDSWLIVAIDIGNLESVAWILDNGADINAPVSDGYPPLLAAIESEKPARLDMIRLLIARGADLSSLGINGWSALHLAAMRDDLKALEILLKAGADPNLRTNCDDYFTAEEEARNLGRVKSADFIAEFVAVNP